VQSVTTRRSLEFDTRVLLDLLFNEAFREVLKKIDGEASRRLRAFLGALYIKRAGCSIIAADHEVPINQKEKVVGDIIARDTLLFEKLIGATTMERLPIEVWVSRQREEGPGSDPCRASHLASS